MTNNLIKKTNTNLSDKMTNLINKILAIFQLKLVSTKSADLVEESVKFLNTIPKGALDNTDWFSTYAELQEKLDIQYGKNGND